MGGNKINRKNRAKLETKIKKAMKQNGDNLWHLPENRTNSRKPTNKIVKHFRYIPVNLERHPVLSSCILEEGGHPQKYTVHMFCLRSSWSFNPLALGHKLRICVLLFVLNFKHYPCYIFSAKIYPYYLSCFFQNI